jgi:hypothetical protein
MFIVKVIYIVTNSTLVRSSTADTRTRDNNNTDNHR